jgi:hypothetical protein
VGFLCRDKQFRKKALNFLPDYVTEEKRLLKIEFEAKLRVRATARPKLGRSVSETFFYTLCKRDSLGRDLQVPQPSFFRTETEDPSSINHYNAARIFPLKLFLQNRTLFCVSEKMNLDKRSELTLIETIFCSCKWYFDSMWALSTSTPVWER